MLRKFYYELAQGNTQAQIAALLKMAPLSQVLYGTDYPFRPGAEVNDGIAAYGFSPDDIRSIEREAALKLIPAPESSLKAAWSRHGPNARQFSRPDAAPRLLARLRRVRCATTTGSRRLDPEVRRPAAICCHRDRRRSELGRRNFSRAALAALGLARRRTLGAPAVRRRPAKTRIDVHHHFLPEAHREALTRHKAGAPKWTPQMSLDDMDKSGIATSILSQVQPGTWWGDAAESRALSRTINEYGAKLVRDHPGRFGLFATISPPDVEGSLKEIEYAFDTLKADGLGLLTSYQGKYLGDASFAPVYQELNRRKAVIYVHPLTAACCDNLVPGIPPGSIEYATDTTRTIAHLVFSGTAQKFPDIRWIFSHSGGTLPFLTQRFVRQQMVQKHAHLPNGPMPEFRKFYYELAQGNTAGQLAALFKMVPVVAGALRHRLSVPRRRRGQRRHRGHGFNAADLRAIERETALKLLPRLKAA